VFHVGMFFAFICASITNICADLTQLLRLAASKAHQLCGCVTNCRAFHVQLNTSGHHLNILFLRTRACTIVTDRRTLKTCFNA
jgi:hypothetical protein